MEGPLSPQCLKSEILPSPILGIPRYKGTFSGDPTTMHFYSITLVSTQNRQRRSATERQDRGSSDHFGDLLEEHRSQGIKSSLGGERGEMKIREDGPVRTGQEWGHEPADPALH